LGEPSTKQTLSGTTNVVVELIKHNNNITFSIMAKLIVERGSRTKFNLWPRAPDITKIVK